MNTSEHYKFGVQVVVGRNVFSWRPKVSVIIPAYNVTEFIGDALESVKAQKFRDHEIIVVNDGSPDTVAFERAIRPHMQDIVYIKQPNLGAGAARNTAIRHARGEMIAFLDGDDIWLPDFLSSQVAFLGKGYEMVYCDAQQFGMRSALRRTFMELAPSVGEVTAESLLDYKCNVITSGTVVLKTAVVAAGLFEHERARAHDFHLWVRIAKKGYKIGYQEKILLKYRVHLDGLSGDSVSRVEREIDVFKRVTDSIELSENEKAIIERRVNLLKGDLHVEYGKSYLLNDDFASAAKAFSEANSYRRSWKLTGIALLARFAPRLLLNHYRTHRSDDIQFVPTQTPARRST